MPAKYFEAICKGKCGERKRVAMRKVEKSIEGENKIVLVPMCDSCEIHRKYFRHCALCYNPDDPQKDFKRICKFKNPNGEGLICQQCRDGLFRKAICPTCTDGVKKTCIHVSKNPKVSAIGRICSWCAHQERKGNSPAIAVPQVSEKKDLTFYKTLPLPPEEELFAHVLPHKFSMMFQ